MARIHTGRKSGFVLRGGSLRRETVWIDVVESFNALPVGTSILLNVTGAGVLALRPFTVVRTRGMIGIRTDQVAATEDQAASFGYAIVSDQAVAIGVTAVPTPVTDRSSDAWFVYEDILADINSVGSATSNMGKTGEYKDYDSRAMRKVEDGFQMITVVESPAVGIAQGANFKHVGRLLIKLH